MKKKKKALKIIIVLVIALVIVAGVVYFLKYYQKGDPVVNGNTTNQPIENLPPVEEKKLQIYQGTERTIAVMIDNEKPAWPHSGLQDAYMIYEALIEGGESRLMALFKGQTTAKIGPIRSARHYFVHYAMEQSAVFCHFGWSPKAQTTIQRNNVNNINGIYDEYYWRIGSGYHNAYTSIEKIKQYASKKDYLMVGSEEPKYQYSIDEIDLENGIDITGLKIKYSNLHNVSYEYSEEDKVFYRSMRGIVDKDRETGKQYFAKNIIVMYVENYTLNDGENKGRQELENIGTGEGYFITNGKQEPITWKKDAISSKTLWLDKTGKEITLNDGITYVQIVPINNKVDFTLKEVVPPVTEENS